MTYLFCLQDEEVEPRERGDDNGMPVLHFTHYAICVADHTWKSWKTLPIISQSVRLRVSSGCRIRSASLVSVPARDDSPWI